MSIILFKDRDKTISSVVKSEEEDVNEQDIEQTSNRSAKDCNELADIQLKILTCKNIDKPACLVNKVKEGNFENLTTNNVDYDGPAKKDTMTITANPMKNSSHVSHSIAFNDSKKI